MRNRSRFHPLHLSLPFLLAPALLTGCSDAPEAAEEAMEASMLEAATSIVALFDSITWARPADALDRGATVYAYSCRRCHGDRGAGDGGYQLEGRVIRPPSFRAADWHYGRDLDGLRRAIWDGKDTRGMPHWGKKGLSPRDADAVARYITRRLWQAAG